MIKTLMRLLMLACTEARVVVKTSLYNNTITKHACTKRKNTVTSWKNAESRKTATCA